MVAGEEEEKRGGKEEEAFGKHTWKWVRSKYLGTYFLP